VRNFAAKQLVEFCRHRGLPDAIDLALAGAPTVEAEHQTGLLGRAPEAVHLHAESPVPATQCGGAVLLVIKPGVPEE